MYIRDESADAIVRANATIQDAVQGKSIMLWLPGQSAGVGVNMCLMFGWMGTAISVYRMVPELRQAMEWFLLGVLVLSAAMGIHWFMIVRGHRSGRTRMFWHAAATLAAGLLVATTALVRADMIAAYLAGGGTAFTLVALRLVAGPSYALFAAFFRAKRAYESSTRQSS